MKKQYQYTYNPDSHELKIQGKTVGSLAYDVARGHALLSINPDQDSEAVKRISDDVVTHLSSEGKFKMYLSVGTDSKQNLEKDEAYESDSVNELMFFDFSKGKPKVENLRPLPEKLKGIKFVNDKKILLKYAEEISKFIRKDASWTDDFYPDKIRRIIQHATTCYGIFNGDEVIGFIRLLTNGTLIYLSDFVVKSEYQGKGIGQNTTQYLFDHWPKELKLALLTAGGEDKRAEDIYKMFGFIDSSENHDLDSGISLFFRKNIAHRKGLESPIKIVEKSAFFGESKDISQSGDETLTYNKN